MVDGQTLDSFCLGLIIRENGQTGKFDPVILKGSAFSINRSTKHAKACECHYRSSHFVSFSGIRRQTGFCIFLFQIILKN
jgi:hypothetical protein